MTLFIVFASIFAIAHLTFCYLDLEKIRKITKCMVFIPLLVWMIVMERSLWIIFALIAGIIGDFFLIFIKNKKMLIPGGTAFLIGHALYLAEVFNKINKDMPYFYFIIAGVMGILCGILVIVLMKKTFKEYTLSVGMYVMVLTFELFMMVLLCIFNKNSLCLLPLFGSIFFVASDSILGYKEFVHEIPKREFFVMLTYILAQTLLCVGLSLL